MNWLATLGYRSITLDELVDARRGNRSLPSKSVLITFDDGYLDSINYAAPVLAERGFTATFFLVAGLMGSTSRWLIRELGVELPLLDWSAARELEKAGFHCGSHTMSHPRLAEISPEACRYELEGSRRLLEERLGHEVMHLAFPYGSYDETVRLAAKRAGYRSACSVRIGLSHSGDDPLALHRVPVDGRDSLTDFISRLHTAQTVGELLRGKARGALLRLRTAAS